MNQNGDSVGEMCHWGLGVMLEVHSGFSGGSIPHARWRTPLDSVVSFRQHSPRVGIVLR